jgi:NAD-dependent dihydropyrimidine dehydrogenase PreA subunit
MRYIAGVVTLKYDSSKCAGCKRCVEVCPHRVFRMKDTKAEIADKDLCIECGACQSNCEFGAITVNRGVGCAVAFINGMITGGEPLCDCSGASEASSCC